MRESFRVCLQPSVTINSGQSFPWLRVKMYCFEPWRKGNSAKTVDRNATFGFTDVYGLQVRQAWHNLSNILQPRRVIPVKSME